MTGICESARSEAQRGIADAGSPYKKYPGLSTVADSEQGDDNFLTCDIAGWFHRSRYVALLILASHREDLTLLPLSPGETGPRFQVNRMLSWSAGSLSRLQNFSFSFGKLFKNPLNIHSLFLSLYEMRSLGITY